MLPEIWFGLVAFLFIGYAVLGGFDLGVGVIHLATSDENERRGRLNAIGPVWDGNGVWLVAAGGALFAAFPEAYAAIFSGFYGALMLFLAALILRKVAIEFRGKLESPAWRRSWDALFSLGSLGTTLLLGTAVGNLLHGVPLTTDKEYLGGLPGLLNPFGLFSGLVAVLVFALHGALYLVMKTDGDHRAAVRSIARSVAPPAVIASFAMFFWSLTFEHLAGRGVGLAIAVLTPGVMLLMAIFGRLRRGNADRLAFAFSSVFIAAIGVFIAAGIFPSIMVGSPAATSLGIREAASSPATLRNMLVIAAIGMPLVLGYTWFIHRLFRGPVRLDDASY